MATTTPNYGWPVPTSTDYVKDGAVAIEALGDAIDATVFALGSGLTLVKTQTIGSAVTSVIVTSAFSATYDNYLITVSDTACSLANDNVGFQLRTGTSTANTNYRYSGLYTAYNTTLGYTVSTSNSQMLGLGRGLAAAEKTSFAFFVYSPFLANKTIMNGLGYVGSDLAGYTNGYHSTATSYDQFVLNAVDGGNLTGGTVKVYGYQK